MPSSRKTIIGKSVLLTALSITALLTMLMAAMVPGKTSAQTNPTNTPAPTATTAVIQAGTGSMQLVYWNGLTGGDGTTMDKMVDAFVKDNTDISVRQEQYVWDTLYQKLQAAFVAGEPPDVIVLHNSEIPQFQKLGLFAPVDDLFDTNGGPLPLKDFTEPALDATVIGGKHYGVLLDNHGFGTWVNLNLFKSAGVDENTAPPKSPDEFIKLATKLTLDKNGKHPDEAGFDLQNVTQWGTGIDWTRVQFESFLYQFGGSVVSADLKTATINSQAGQQALQAMYDLIYKYHVAPDANKTNGYNAFQAGTIAIMPTGTWFRNNLVDLHKEIKWTVWPMLQLGPKPGVWASAHVMFISSTLTGDKLAAAKKMVVYLSNHNDIWAQSGQVPARISVQKGLDPETYKSNILFGQGFQQFGRLEPPLTDLVEVQNAFDPELSAALNGQKTVKQALDDANARMQTILDRGQ